MIIPALNKDMFAASDRGVVLITSTVSFGTIGSDRDIFIAQFWISVRTVVQMEGSSSQP